MWSASPLDLQLLLMLNLLFICLETHMQVTIPLFCSTHRYRRETQAKEPYSDPVFQHVPKAEILKAEILK